MSRKIEYEPIAAQYVGVRTAAGTVVVASDTVYLYENIEQHRPSAQTGAVTEGRRDAASPACIVAIGRLC